MTLCFFCLRRCCQLYKSWSCPDEALGWSTALCSHAGCLRAFACPNVSTVLPLSCLITSLMDLDSAFWLTSHTLLMLLLSQTVSVHSYCSLTCRFLCSLFLLVLPMTALLGLTCVWEFPKALVLQAHSLNVCLNDFICPHSWELFL